MPIYRLGDDTPAIADDAFIAPEAVLIGKVTVGALSTLWFGAVIRGDNEPITIGARTSIQEGVVMHTDLGQPLTVGDDATIGHQAMLHGCTIGNGVLVGMQAIVLDGAVIGDESLVGAGAIVTAGKRFPPRSLILGAPAKLVRELTDEDLARMRDGADFYVKRGQVYRRDLVRVG